MLRERVARLLHADVTHAARIQSLWSGYGTLSRLALADGRSVIVKHVRPPPTARGISDTRKRRSYDVELAFYQTVAPRCDATCRVATLLAAAHADDEWLLVLEDLAAAGFVHEPDDATALARCLGWLAAFHARFLGEAFPQLWPIGTYWHLDTRRDELPNIRSRAIRETAEPLATRLDGAHFQTLLHGDAKEANFLLSSQRSTVAAVDFQYTGRGAGIRDVAYLLHGHDDRALDSYFHALHTHLPPTVDGDALEAEWRALYPVAQQDFARFLAGWRG